MFFILDDLIDAEVIATDGEIGRVRNFFFDDQTWTIRYLVVEVGNWLSRRDVLISITAIDQPDWQKKIFRVRLTKEQVRHSPDVDSQKPVSRQQEIAMREHFGWPAAWEHMGEILTAEFPPASLPIGRGIPTCAIPGEDPHLRSPSDVDGYEVWSHSQRHRASGEFRCGRSLLASSLPRCENGRLASPALDVGSHKLCSLNIVGSSSRPSAAGNQIRDSLTGVITEGNASFHRLRRGVFSLSARKCDVLETVTCSDMNPS